MNRKLFHWVEILIYKLVIAGAIAHAFYENIPEDILQEVNDKLPDDLLKVLHPFNKKFKNIIEVDRIYEMKRTL